MKQNYIKNVSQIALFVASFTFGVGCTNTAAPHATAPSSKVEVHDVASPSIATEQDLSNSGHAKKNLHPLSSSGALAAPLPIGVTSFGGAVQDGYLYVLGGYHGTPHDYSNEGQSKSIQRLSLAQPVKWETFAQMEQSLQGLAAFAYDGKICYAGGTHTYNSSGEATEMRSVPGVRCLSTVDKSWTELPQLKAPRSSHEAAVSEGTLYVAGGWDLRGSPKDAVWSEDILSLDLKSPSPRWQSIVAPFRVRAAGVAATKTHLVVAGGLSPEEGPTKNVHLYNFANKTWSTGPQYPAFAFGIALRAVEGVVYASGRDGVLRRFTPGEEKWTDVRTLAYPRFFHQMLQSKTSFVMVGGIGGMHTRGRTRPVEIVPWDKKTTSWGQYILPHEGQAKNRQGILRNGEELYFFGGNNSLGQHDFARENFIDEGFIFDLATLSYQRTSAFPVERQSMITLSTDNGGLAVGGFGFSLAKSSDIPDASTQKDVYSFNWEQKVWSQLSQLERGRTQFGLLTHGRKNWIFGGLNYNASRKGAAAFDHIKETLVAKEGEAFSVAPPVLPGPRRAFAGALLKDKYYMVGGMKEGFSLVDDCVVYDFETTAFSQLPCPGGPRLSGELIAAGGLLYLIGGMVKDGTELKESRSIEVYDPKTTKWSLLDFQLPLSTRHLRAMPYRDQILLLTTHCDKPELTIAFLSPGR